MSLQSCSNSANDGASGSPSCSTSSSSMEIINLPLGIHSGINISNDDQQLLNIVNDLPAGPNPVTIISSDGAKVGPEYNITFHSIEGNTNIHISNYNKPEPPVQEDPQNDGQVAIPDGPLEKFPKSLKYLLKDRPTQLWLAGLLLVLMSVIALALFFSLHDYDGSRNPPPTSGHDDNLGDGIQIIHRKEWLARDPLNTTRYAQPPRMVRILHTASDHCSDYQTCATRILGLQGSQVVGLGVPDIIYNFMIGGDGNVYIGRGADVMSDDRWDALDIAFVGNFLPPYDKVSDKMDQAGRRLIQRLLDRKKITPDYIVVAQNQTEKTTSPGENVYKKIISWPHYDPNNHY